MIRAFVSSTYRDLRDHRAYVIDRLTQSGIFVDPMKKWTAASDEPRLAAEYAVHVIGLLDQYRFRAGVIVTGPGATALAENFLFGSLSPGV